MSTLTAEKVSEIFQKCLFKDGEVTSVFVLAQGITASVGFHSGRLSECSSEIETFLKELPLSFQESGGKGMSFLQACEDKHGNMWTGSHATMQELFLLGLATGWVEECLPRFTWGALPGGVPYYMVRETPVEVTTEER